MVCTQLPAVYLFKPVGIQNQIQWGRHAAAADETITGPDQMARIHQSGLEKRGHPAPRLQS